MERLPRPPWAARLLPVTTLAPLLTVLVICASRPPQRPDHGTRPEPVDNLHRVGGLGEAPG